MAKCAPSPDLPAVGSSFSQQLKRITQAANLLTDPQFSDSYKTPQASQCSIPDLQGELLVDSQVLSQLRNSEVSWNMDFPQA